MLLSVVTDLLSLIRDTENDELASALQKFVCQFSGDIAPLAVEVTKHLVSSVNILNFQQFVFHCSCYMFFQYFITSFISMFFFAVSKLKRRNNYDILNLKLLIKLYFWTSY